MTTIQADWLNRPGVKRVVEALGSDTIRFVGGAVRDTLCDRPVADLDAATTHSPIKVMLLLETADIKVIPTGLKHGTITAIADSEPIEITTLRVDQETDGRHAEVQFTDSWLEDAKRRDFTFNAMYLSPDGKLFDPFDGKVDLKAGRVRFIGNAAERIEEDALRILRYFRFLARYGKAPDAKTAKVLHTKRHMLSKLSAERIRDELYKILACAQLELSLKTMDELGIFTEIFGEGCSVVDVLDFAAHESRSCNLLARLYFLTRSVLEPAELGRRLKLSNAEKARLKRFKTVEKMLASDDPDLIRKLIYKHGREAVLIHLCKDKAEQDLMQMAETWNVPEFPLKGRDLVEVGVAAGPLMGKALKELEQKWVDSNFKLAKSDLLKLE